MKTRIMEHRGSIPDLILRDLTIPLEGKEAPWEAFPLPRDNPPCEPNLSQSQRTLFLLPSFILTIVIKEDNNDYMKRNNCMLRFCWSHFEIGSLFAEYCNIVGSGCDACEYFLTLRGKRLNRMQLGSNESPDPRIRVSDAATHLAALSRIWVHLKLAGKQQRISKFYSEQIESYLQPTASLSRHPTPSYPPNMHHSPYRPAPDPPAHHPSTDAHTQSSCPRPSRRVNRQHERLP